MAHLTATVIHADESDVRLRAQRQGACSQCHAKSHCAVLAMENDNERTFLSETQAALKPNQTVQVTIDDRVVLVYLAYALLPTLLTTIVLTGVLTLMSSPPLLLAAGFLVGIGTGQRISSYLLRKNQQYLQNTLCITPASSD